MELILQVENLCKTYKKSDFKLQSVSLAIERGTIMGFVGKNGAGKSTTINAILNLIHPDSGTVKIFGSELQDERKDMRESIGVVFDNIHFSGELTPIKLEKVMADVYSFWDKARFFEFLKRFDIQGNKKIKTLSRGTTMKLSIGVAMSHGAKLLILDEATSGLDPVAREELLDLLLAFVEDENNSVFISSHISSDLEKIADHITFIDKGTIILNEKKDTLLYDYGIARMKQADFESLDESEYLSYRHRGLQFEVLVQSQKEFLQNHPHILVDHASIDEILPLITKEAS